MPLTPRNPHLHPVVLVPLLAGFVALAGVVWYIISPVPAYQQEQTATATAGEPYWVTRTSSRTPRTLPEAEQHWRTHFEFTGANGERGLLAKDSRPGADKPAAGETALVRYRPDPIRAAGHQTTPIPARFADGVTLWGEGRWYLAGWVAMTLFAAAVGMVYVSRWRAAEAIRTAHARGELTDTEAAEQMAFALI